MADYLDAVAFLALNAPVVDVRSPAEFSHGHIPGALNIPLFTDDQRAVVGTLYAQSGKQAAVIKGLEFAGPAMHKFVKQALEISDNGLLNVYCWRGGMRSAAMAFLFETAGIKVNVLHGGYKAFRNHVLDFLSQKFNLQVIGGMTGTGKTEVLYELRKLGEQVIDLEGLANHRGSAFGSFGMDSQPSSEFFSNLLWKQMSQFDIQKPVWIEDESISIGSCFIPDYFFNRMRAATMHVISLPVEERVEKLITAYGNFDQTLLTQAIGKIRKRLGNDKADEAAGCVLSGNLARAVIIVLSYYDKAYAYSMQSRSGEVEILDAAGRKPLEIAKMLL
jgi:tRNA 2-selenouridine synthase